MSSLLPILVTLLVGNTASSQIPNLIQREFGGVAKILTQKCTVFLNQDRPNPFPLKKTFEVSHQKSISQIFLSLTNADFILEPGQSLAGSDLANPFVIKLDLTLVRIPPNYEQIDMFTLRARVLFKTAKSSAPIFLETSENSRTLAASIDGRLGVKPASELLNLTPYDVFESANAPEWAPIRFRVSCSASQ